MHAALAADDSHAHGVCESRAFLAAHMTARAREAFAGALAECLTPGASPR
jgi:hypothetical protein